MSLLTNVAEGDEYKGKYFMFKLSDGKLWLITKENNWDWKKSGSFVYQDGMLWAGFAHPFAEKKWSKFGVVQLDKEEDKDKFFFSGGIVDGAPSMKSYLYDAIVRISQ